MSSARLAAEQDIRSEMLHVRTVTSNHQANAPNHVLSSTDNVRTRVIADGNWENGRIVLVLDFKSAGSTVGIITRIKQLVVVMMERNLQLVNDAVHHQTVIKSQPLDFSPTFHFQFLNRLMQKHSTLPTNTKRWRI